MRLAVPATTANLGPGYDCLGLALNLFNYLELEPADSWELVIRGEGAETLPRDKTNLVWRSMERLWQEVGASAQRLKFSWRTGFPWAGLGSSAAAIVGG